jgi:hypothetical protein
MLVVLKLTAINRSKKEQLLFDQPVFISGKKKPLWRGAFLNRLKYISTDPQPELCASLLKCQTP